MGKTTGSSPALLVLNSSKEILGSKQSARVVEVHPLVVLSVLDHHTRRNEGVGRVIGTLLGRRDGDKVSIIVLVSLIRKILADDLVLLCRLK